MAYGNGGETMSSFATENRYGGQALPPQASAARQSAGNEIDARGKQAEILHDLLNQLEQRLTPVLRPSGPSTAGNQPVSPAPIASPVVDLLRQQGFRMDAALARIQDVIDRIEL